MTNEQKEYLQNLIDENNEKGYFKVPLLFEKGLIGDYPHDYVLYNYSEVFQMLDFMIHPKVWSKMLEFQILPEENNSVITDGVESWMEENPYKELTPEIKEKFETHFFDVIIPTMFQQCEISSRETVNDLEMEKEDWTEEDYIDHDWIGTELDKVKRFEDLKTSNLQKWSEYS